MNGLGALALLAVLAALPWGSVRRPVTPAPPRRRALVPSPVDAAVLLDLAGAAMAAGASVPAVLQALGRAVGEDDEVGRALRSAGVALVLGAPWPDAWHSSPPVAQHVGRALEPAWVDGAAPDTLVARAAEGIRARRHRQAREDAARLGVRLVLPLGLCFLPAFVLLGIVPVLLAAGGAILAP
ncbi:type II secretion system F family protein [Georgenia faecalis]|uniref:Type II secretion system F family protein n=1 Tax=Georgenia faecalis TaxID=2483799 RepID=A0ABV9D5H2_9MICO|nr:type II secretion system F family protein [Georgenia faecalis]